MIIRKNSWHFKVVDFYDNVYTWQIERKGTTLCDYFWKVVESLMAIIISGLTLAALITSFVFILVITPVLVLFVGTTSSAILGVVPVSGFLWACIIAGCIAAFVQQNSSPSVKKKEPGLIMSYIRAKKQKFCPRVEVKDEV